MEVLVDLNVLASTTVMLVLAVVLVVDLRIVHPSSEAARRKAGGKLASSRRGFERAE